MCQMSGYGMGAVGQVEPMCLINQAMPKIKMDNRPTGTRICLYDTEQLRLVIEQMADQIFALVGNRKLLAVVGILRRGAPLADRLTEALVSRHGITQPLRLDLSVKRYADDLSLLYPETRLTENAQHASLSLDGYTLLVVDDVLYTGYSMLKVVEYLIHKKPTDIFTATLVDRVTNRVPIRSSVVGVQLRVSPGDIIECNVPPYESEFKIELLQPATKHP